MELPVSPAEDSGVWNARVSLMPDPPLFVFALLLVGTSAVIQGTTGFGFNILVVPLLSLFFDPKVVIPTVIIHNIVLDGLVLATAWQSANLRRIWVLVLAGVLGTPVGVLLLSIINPEPLRVAIGLVVVLTGIALLLGFRRTIANELVASGVAGSLGGTMNSLVGMAGPPVILLFANQGMAPEEFRANIVTYFTIITVLAIASFWAKGSLDADVLTLAAVTMPATVLGVLLGIRLHSRVSGEQFLRASLFLVVLAGSASFIAGLLAL